MGRQPTIEIDSHSGFCFGVTSSISKAEAELKSSRRLYCLGDLVHNSAEMDRLQALGLTAISHVGIPTVAGERLMLRAHGEPPSTYELARRNNIEIVDATCPVVLKLQQRIAQAYKNAGEDTQIVIYGHAGHAEVNGLVGQTEGRAIVVDDGDNLDKIDFTRPVMLYSQTTRSIEGFQSMVEQIGRRLAPGVGFEHFDTICRQVSGRVEHLRKFAREHDVVLFVSGSKSSNGKVLFNHCLAENSDTHMIGNPSEIDCQWLSDRTIESIGICGATSTPRWLMEEVMKRCREIIESGGDE